MVPLSFLVGIHITLHYGRQTGMKHSKYNNISTFDLVISHLGIYPKKITESQYPIHLQRCPLQDC